MHATNLRYNQLFVVADFGENALALYGRSSGHHGCVQTLTTAVGATHVFVDLTLNASSKAMPKATSLFFSQRVDAAADAAENITNGVADSRPNTFERPTLMRLTLHLWHEFVHHSLSHQVGRQQALRQNEIMKLPLVELRT